MATEFEIVGRREMPGLVEGNARAVSVVVIYRAVGDPNRTGFVILPLDRASDAQVNDAIAAKERTKAPATPRRVTVE